MKLVCAEVHVDCLALCWLLLLFGGALTLTLALNSTPTPTWSLISF